MNTKDKNIKDILIEQDIYRFIMNIRDDKIREDVLLKCEVKEYKAEEILYHSTEGHSSVSIILSGKVNVRAFINDSTDYIVPWDNKHWYGLLSLLAEDFTEVEIFFLEDTRVLHIPLKKILFSEPKENYELWMKISKMAALSLRSVHTTAIKRAALSSEAYFLTLFIENGYHFENLSIPELSYVIKVNTRTLQRLVQNLEKNGLIDRDKSKKIISAKDKSKIDEYLNSII